MQNLGTVWGIAPADSTLPSASHERSEFDEKIENAVSDYTQRVRDDSAYEDTTHPDDLRRRYDKQ